MWKKNWFLNPRFIGSLSLALLVGGCTATTVPPTQTQKESSVTTVINKPVEETWQAVIDYAGTTFFVIDNVAKDSGLMTMSFGSNNPGDFIDCGTWSFGNRSGPFVLIVAQEGAPNALNGKLNVLVKEIAPGRSQITVKARYVYQVTDLNRATTTWAFNTGDRATNRMGLGNTVTCVPTGKVENDLIAGTRGKLGL